MVTPQNFKGIGKFVASKVVGTPDGSPALFHRIAELHFPSMEVLQAAAASPSAQQVIAHAVHLEWRQADLPGCRGRNAHVLRRRSILAPGGHRTRDTDHGDPELDRRVADAAAGQTMTADVEARSPAPAAITAAPTGPS
jgi:hypothetical protein